MGHAMRIGRIIGAVAALLLPAVALALSPTQADIPYGPDKQQRLDVYAPAGAMHAPVIVMVHGGGWRIGDKAHGGVTGSKAEHYLARGYMFVSINYRMENAVTPLDEAADVAQALDYVRRHAQSWGGDASHLVLMGHSAGAHLVALLSADPAHANLAPWRATVVLDSAALDVPRVMQARHMGLYDDAFGKDEALWTAASPYHQLTRGAVPMLLVCSSRRLDSCPQATAFAAKAKEIGAEAATLPEDLSHMEINRSLGETGAYTNAVDQFIDGKMR